MAITDRAFERGERDAAARSAGARPQVDAIAQAAQHALTNRAEGRVLFFAFTPRASEDPRLDPELAREAEAIMAANRPVEHPVFKEGRKFVAQIEAGGTVQVSGVSRLPSGFRNYSGNGR